VIAESANSATRTCRRALRVERRHAGGGRRARLKRLPGRNIVGPGSGERAVLPVEGKDLDRSFAIMLLGRRSGCCHLVGSPVVRHVTDSTFPTESERQRIAYSERLFDVERESGEKVAERVPASANPRTMERTADVATIRRASVDTSV